MPRDDDRIKLQPNDILVLDKKYTVTKTLNSGGTSVCYMVKDDNSITYVIKEYYPQHFFDRFAFIRNNDGLLEFSGSVNETDRQTFTNAVDRQIIAETQLNKIILNDGENNSRFVFAFEPIDSNANIAAKYAKVNTETGKCLSTYGGRWKLEKIVDVLEQIALSVYFAIHCKKYLHLDIKPDNLYWCEDRIRVLDFGASVRQGRQNFQDIMNSPGYSGTEGYCSPLLQEIYNKRQTIAEMSYFYTDENDVQKLEELVAQLSVKDDIFSIMRCFLYLIFGCGYGALVERYSELNHADELDILRQALLDCEKINNLYVHHIISMFQKAKNAVYDTLIETDSETCSLMADIIALREICENKGYHPETAIAKGKRFLKNTFENMHITISDEILPAISYRDNDGQEISVLSLSNAINNLQKDNVRLFTLTANGGYGKTVTLFNYAQSCFEHDQESETPIPLFVSLNSIENTKHSLVEYIDNIYFSGEGHEQLQRFFETSDRSFILLLDGLNELDGNQRSNITQQILFLSKCKNLFIVISSRVDLENFELLANFRQFQRLTLEKLNPQQIEQYAKKCGVENVSDTLMQILSTPLNLTLYFQTADFWMDILSDDSKNLYYPVENPLSSGEVLLNYIYLQIYKIKSSCAEIPRYGKFGDISTLEHHICSINFYLTKLLPYIAYTMYERDKNDLSSNQAIEELVKGLDYFARHQDILFEEFDVYRQSRWSCQYCFPSSCENAREKCDYLFDEILIKQMGLVYKQKEKYRFFHDNILDVLAMMHVTNQIWFEKVPPLLYKVELYSHTKKLLGEIWHEKHHIPFWNNLTGEWEKPQYVDVALNSLLDHCRHSTDPLIRYATNNVIDIVLSARGELTGLDLSCLDLSNTRLYGVICSRTGKQNTLAANFYGCKFSDNSWKNSKHPISPEYVFLRSDNKIVTLDRVGNFRIWDFEGRLLPNGYGANQYQRISGVITCCAMDGQNNLVVGTKDGHICYLIDGRYQISLQQKAGIKEFIEKCYISKETTSYAGDDFVWAGYVHKKRLLSDNPILSVAVSQDGKQYYFLVDGVKQGEKQRYVYHEQGRPGELEYTEGRLWAVDETIESIELTGDERHLLLHTQELSLCTQVLHLSNAQIDNLPFRLENRDYLKNYTILPQSSFILIYNHHEISIFDCGAMRNDEQYASHFDALSSLSIQHIIPLRDLRHFCVIGYCAENNREELCEFDYKTGQISVKYTGDQLNDAVPLLNGVNRHAILCNSFFPYGGTYLSVFHLTANSCSTFYASSPEIKKQYILETNHILETVSDNRTIKAFDVASGQYLKTVYKRNNLKNILRYDTYIPAISTFMLTNIAEFEMQYGNYSDGEFLFVDADGAVLADLSGPNQSKNFLYHIFDDGTPRIEVEGNLISPYKSVSINCSKQYIYTTQAQERAKGNSVTKNIMLTMTDILHNTSQSRIYPECLSIVLISGNNVICRNFKNKFDIYHPINDTVLFEMEGRKITEMLLLAERAMLWKNNETTFFHVFKSNMICLVTWPYMIDQEKKSIAYINCTRDGAYEFNIMNLSSLSLTKHVFSLDAQPKIVAFGDKSILFSLRTHPHTIWYASLSDNIAPRVILHNIDDFRSITYCEKEDIIIVNQWPNLACFQVSTGRQLYLLEDKDLDVKDCDMRACTGLNDDIGIDLASYGAVL